MPKFAGVGLMFCGLSGLAIVPLAAAEYSSAYTSLKLDACKNVTPADMVDYGSVLQCEGYDGIDVRVAEGDLRIFVSYGPNADKQSAAYETLPQFNTIGETLEWRLVSEGGQADAHRPDPSLPLERRRAERLDARRDQARQGQRLSHGLCRGDQQRRG
jgi:hypothetical protein